MRSKLTWLVFIGLLLFAAIFLSHTARDLPPLVASHFDAAGNATSFMAARGYRRFIFLFAIGLPIALVALTTIAYSRATALKLPNREYWLAPPRIARTRAFLITHGVWFGSLLVSLLCFMHWLVLQANREQPPHLSNQNFLYGLLVLFIGMLVWIGTLMFAFRRPRDAD
jgi:uncharacterized membrane protein